MKNNARTVADYIVRGLDYELKPTIQDKAESVDTVCAITGERIARGIHWRHVIPNSTAEYLDLMHGMTMTHLSLNAATAFKASWNMGSRLIFEDGTMYHPYIAAQSAAKSERTYWSALVRDVMPERLGQSCLCIITDDFQKKIWPKARIGQLGPNTQVLFYDSGRLLLQNLIVNWAKLIEVLDFVETVYTSGFNKRAIGESLYNCYGALIEHVQQAQVWELQLSELRSTPEFAVSLLIAQKLLTRADDKQIQLL